MKATLHHQNTMLALRAEIGWPRYQPANNCLAFSTGRVMDSEQAMELARVARLIGADIIYSGWASATTKTMSGLTIAYRERQTVDIIDRAVPYAADATAPIMLVSTRSDETLLVDRRGTLVRVPGRPRDLDKGRKLAMKRIAATARTVAENVGGRMLDTNRWVPTGTESIPPEAETATIVAFA